MHSPFLKAEDLFLFRSENDKAVRAGRNKEIDNIEQSPCQIDATLNKIHNYNP